MSWTLLWHTCGASNGKMPHRQATGQDNRGTSSTEVPLSGSVKLTAKIGHHNSHQHSVFNSHQNGSLSSLTQRSPDSLAQTSKLFNTLLKSQLQRPKKQIIRFVSMAFLVPTSYVNYSCVIVIKILERNNLRQKECILAHGFRVISVLHSSDPSGHLW